MIWSFKFLGPELGVRGRHGGKGQGAFQGSKVGIVGYQPRSMERLIGRCLESPRTASHTDIGSKGREME